MKRSKFIQKLKTKKLLNWKPKVSLYKGLKKIYISYQKDINKKIFNQR